MGHKCYISFKTEDSTYKKCIQSDLDVDMIDKSLNESIQSTNEDYILRKIREGSAVLATAAATLLGKTVFKILWLRETFLRVATGVALGLVGWTIPVLHLSVFDRLFLRRGSIDRILKSAARKSGH